MNKLQVVQEPPKVDVVALGAVLAHLRESSGLSQSQLAEKTGISQPSLSRIERGAGMPDALALRRMADALGVSVNDVHSLVDQSVVQARDLAATATHKKGAADNWWAAAVAVLGVVGVVMLVGLAVAAVFGALKAAKGGRS
jgi:transcriptional regulator with XRE-family HTH domain